MVIRISDLIDEIKRKDALKKKIEVFKIAAKNAAYEYRNTINKREIEDDVNRLDSILPLWELIKKLRKKDKSYDSIIRVDRKGYIDIEIFFPITEKEFNAAYENRANWIKNNGRFASCCCRMDEEIYKVVHQRVEKVLKGVVLRAYGAFEPYGDNYVRRCSVTIAK